MVDEKSLINFIDSSKRVAEEIIQEAEGKNIFLVSHMDADGISAAGVMGKALLRIGAKFCIRIERWMDEKVLSEASNLSEEDNLLVFTDMGSGYLDILGAKLGDRRIIILDHHQPIGKNRESFLHLNPHLFGIDGSREISSSGISYLVAKFLDKRNIDLAYLAVIGALGDLQDKYEGRRLGGVNDLIVKDAVEAGLLSVETDLLFFGRETRPIHKALAYTTSPYIPGISGEEDKSLAFLSGLNIELKRNDRWRALRDLSQDEKRRLFSALHDYLISKGFRSEDIMNTLIGAVYVLVREEPWTPLRDAREYALLLNATGRMNVSGLGVAICMGDRSKAYVEALKVLEEYRQTITKYLIWLNNNPSRIEEWENIYVLHGEKDIDERAISSISTIISMTLPKPSKPLVAYSYIPREKVIKISARVTDSLAKAGLNIGEIIRIAAEKFSGIGGGHDVAAGAQIPYEQKMQFLKYVDSLVKEGIMRLESREG
ncbi:MAG: DHH family phosphoesterase, partial [Candidatus Bathyarchaeota archaeon]|nr:DHH family phosphoesterase [Candidatus Bathyarchaeota archaeon]